MNAGVRTPNVSFRVPVADSLVVNRENSTGLQSINDLSTQLGSTGLIGNSLSALSSGVGTIAKATFADLTADLAHAADGLAWVYADPAVANNGVYRKLGASGAGSWTRMSDLPFSFVVGTDLGEGTPNALQVTTSIPVSAASLIRFAVFQPNTEEGVTVSFNGADPITIKTNSGNDVSAGGISAGMILLGAIANGEFRLQTDQSSTAVVAAAEAARDAAQAAGEHATSLVGKAENALQPGDAATPAQGANADTAVQPPSINLTPTQTTAAIQAIVDEAADNGGRVQLKRGDYSIANPIKTGARAIRLQGSGNLQSRLIANGVGKSVIEHGLDAQTYFASLSAENLNINSAVNRPNRGIDAIFDRDSGGFELRDIRFSGFGGDYCFQEYIRAIGATNTKFWNVVGVTSSNSANTAAERAVATQVGLHFISNNNADKSYVYEFNSCSIDANNIGILLDVLGVPGDSGSLEGIIARNCLGRTNIGPWFKLNIPNSASVWQPPFYEFDTCNWQGPGAFAHLDAVSVMGVRNGCLYVDSALPILGGGTTPALNTIQIGYGKHIIIENNLIELLPGSKAAYLIRLLAGCDNVIIRNNTFVYPSSGSADFTGGILVDPSITNFQHYGNQFKNWPAGKPKIWDGTSEIPARMEMSGAGANFMINGLAALSVQGSGAIANFLQIIASTTGFGPLLRAGGSDTNVQLNLQAQGAAPVVALNPLRIPTFTVSTLPAAAVYGQCMIYVSNGASSKRLAISDGSSWRFPDGAVVS